MLLATFYLWFVVEVATGKTTRLMSWPDGERYLRSPQSLVVSLLLSLVSSLLFSGSGGALSLLNSSTHRFLRFPPRNLCSLVTLAVFSFVYAATDTAFCSYLSRIGRIKNPSCSVCGHSFQNTSHLILHCPATDSLRRLLFGDPVSLRPLVQALGSFPASGASAMPPSLRRGRVTNKYWMGCSFVLPLTFIYILFSIHSISDFLYFLPGHD